MEDSSSSLPNAADPPGRRPGGRPGAAAGQQGGEARAELGFWRSLGTAERQALGERGDERRFPAGSVLCREGETSSEVFVIRSGWTKVSSKIHGRDQIVAIRGAGDVIGERSANTVTGVRSATVTALDDVRALVLTAGQFAEALARYPDALEIVQRLDKERQGEDGARRSSIEPTGSESDLAELILELAQRCGAGGSAQAARIALPMSHEELASWADDYPHAVTRYLRSWRERGIVPVDRRRLVVFDVTRLRRRRDEITRGGRLTASPGQAPGARTGLHPVRALVHGMATMLDFNGVLALQTRTRSAAEDMALAWRDVTRTLRIPAAGRPSQAGEPPVADDDHTPGRQRAHDPPGTGTPGGDPP